jgi:hypothetical protein
MRPRTTNGFGAFLAKARDECGRVRRFFGLAVLLTLSMGCQRRIGEACRTNQECSGETQRICDVSQPGGYCTVLNCTPTSCPNGESVCVTFGSAISPLPACQNGSKPSPYARSLCMRFCERNEDCRVGYECVDISGDDPWSADIVSVSTRTKICLAERLWSELPEDRSGEVCTGEFGGGGAGYGGYGGQLEP